MSVSDGTNTVSETLTITIGTHAQINTFNILKGMMNKTLQGDVPNLIILSNGTLTSHINVSFYNGVATSASYIILLNGDIMMDVANMHTDMIEYSVSYNTITNQMIFTSIANTSYIYKVAI